MNYFHVDYITTIQIFQLIGDFAFKTSAQTLLRHTSLSIFRVRKPLLEKGQIKSPTLKTTSTYLHLSVTEVIVGS